MERKRQIARSRDEKTLLVSHKREYKKKGRTNGESETGQLAYSNRFEVARLVRRQGLTTILDLMNPLHIFTNVALYEYERDAFSSATMLAL